MKKKKAFLKFYKYYYILYINKQFTEMEKITQYNNKIPQNYLIIS